MPSLQPCGYPACMEVQRLLDRGKRFIGEIWYVGRVSDQYSATMIIRRYCDVTKTTVAVSIT